MGTESRIKRLHSLLEERNLGGFFTMNASTVRYFSGVIANRYPERSVYFLSTKRSNFVLTYSLELEQTKAEAEGCEVIEMKVETSLEDIIAGLLDNENLALELDYTPYSIAKRLERKGLRLEDVSQDIAKIRAIKEDDEIEQIREAIRKTEKTLEYFRDEILNRKITEREAAMLLLTNMIENGCEWFAFEPIVASGKNGAYPHAVPSDHEIQEDTFTIIDIGGRNKAGGYCADITRTFIKGNVTKEDKQNFEAVKEALEVAIDEIREGALAKEIDAVARKVLAKYGLDKYFIHGLGHGLGLDVHEYPSLNKVSEAVLKEGYVVTVEPGIYLPNQYGIRLEQDVLVTKNKAEILTKFPIEI